jgi:hypothetical protein
MRGVVLHFLPADNASKSTENTSKHEVERNKVFLSLQDMLPKILGVSKSESSWVNALVRFKNTASEEYENIN